MSPPCFLDPECHLGLHNELHDRPFGTDWKPRAGTTSNAKRATCKLVKVSGFARPTAMQPFFINHAKPGGGSTTRIRADARMLMNLWMSFVCAKAKQTLAKVFSQRRKARSHRAVWQRGHDLSRNVMSCVGDAHRKPSISTLCSEGS